MRVIGGRLKGRRLNAVRGKIRPTADRVREAIFNILGADIHQARIVDLFAGTGALGIEALSRGAKCAVFVEHHASALKVLQRNLQDLGLTGVSRVLPLAVATALPKLAAGREEFDVIFLDPPYGSGLAPATVHLLAEHKLLAAGGRIIVEHSRAEDFSATYPSLVCQDQRHYGDTVVSFFAKRPEEGLQDG